MSEKERFVVGSNEIGEIIVTDVETGKVYRYDNIHNFFGLIRLMNDEHERQNNEIKGLREAYSKIPKGIREVWKE